MTPPTGWKIIDTGGGGTAFYLPIPDSVLEWEIAQPDAPTVPNQVNEPCVLTLYVTGGPLIAWRCSCLAEATQIAEGARL